MNSNTLDNIEERVNRRESLDDLSSETQLEDGSALENELMAEKGNSQHASKVIKLFCKINEKFAIDYESAWMSEADDYDFASEWINALIEEKFSVEAIEKAFKEVQVREEYNTYPPHLRAFISICREMSKTNYNLPQKEDAYLIASKAHMNMPLKDAHVVVKEAARRVGEYALRTDPNMKREFFRVYDVVCKEYTENNGKVPFNTDIEKLADFNGDDSKEPPASKESAISYLDSIISGK